MGVHRLNRVGKSLKYLLPTFVAVFLLLPTGKRFSHGQSTDDDDDVSVVLCATMVTISGHYPAVEGCYERSTEYESLGTKIYTNDGGDVVNGSTIAILGSFVSFEFRRHTSSIYSLSLRSSKVQTGKDTTDSTLCLRSTFLVEYPDMITIKLIECRDRRRPGFIAEMITTDCVKVCINGQSTVDRYVRSLATAEGFLFINPSEPIHAVRVGKLRVISSHKNMAEPNNCYFL